MKQTREMDTKPAREVLKVMVFQLAGHEHAVDARRVQEILVNFRISSVVEAPDFVDGVIKLRGRIVPVINLRKRLQLPEAQAAENSCVIVIHSERNPVGLLVDSASELLTIPVGSIDSPTEVVGGIRTHFIQGIAYLEDRFLVILDIDEILPPREKDLTGETDLVTENLPSGNKAGSLDHRKIIAFELDGELYGVDIEQVVEIMGMVPVMPLPNVPKYILGLINIRGTIVPMMDPRVLLKLDRKPWSLEARIIVLREKNLVVGVVVDRMWELLRLPADAFQPPPAERSRANAEYFKEVTPAGDRMLVVLDIRKILMDTANR